MQSTIHTCARGEKTRYLPEYSYHLVTTLQKLTVLDQQEVSAEVRTNAQKWKASQLGKNFRLCSVSERGTSQI